MFYSALMTKEDIDPVRRGFGQRLATSREMCGLSQTAVGDKFGVGKGTVSAWETGRGDPGVFRLRELAKLFKVSADALLWDNAPTIEAMQMAAEFDSLTERQKSTLRALWIAYIQTATDDATVELRMPITRSEKV